MKRTAAGETRKRVFEFVRGRLLAGEPPTVREVQGALGFRAVQTARQHLEALVREGELLSARGKARGYRLPRTPGISVQVPLLGHVRAGPLTTAVEDLEGYLPFQSDRPGGDFFALRVQGRSMAGAGILPGDIVIVRQQPTARSGEIVVALVDDEATVKRLRMRSRRVELHPENPDFEPIIPKPETVTVLGKVVEVRRKLE